MPDIHFEHFERRVGAVERFLRENGVASLAEADALCAEAGLDISGTVARIQPIAFSDARWALTAGAAAALRRGDADPSVIAGVLGEGLQSFCLPGSVAERRKLGLGHGKLAAMILDEKTRCFAFLAGHESFAAAEGAIGIVRSANRVRKNPLRVILNGMGKDAAEIIARINGFTYVQTRFDYDTGTLAVLGRIAFSRDERKDVLCYGAHEMQEGVAIMAHERVDISISGNGTNMIKFQHMVAGAYKKYCNDNGLPYFACASGGGIGRTLSNDDISAGPASYGLTDTMSRVYADMTFAGSSSVPAHVEMMGFVGMGNNPLVGAVVSTAVAVSKALSDGARAAEETYGSCAG